MPNISKERLDKIKKSYDSVSKPIGDEINGFHLDMMVNTIKEMWKNDISQYNPDPEDVENARNSTIAYYLAMKNFETTLEGKLPDNFNEYLEDMEDVYNNTVDIPEKQLNAIGKNLNKKPEDYENVGYIEENGSTRTMADLRSENTSKEYEKYTEIFNDAFEKIKDRKGKEVIIETNQVSKLRNPSIVITNDDIKDAIEFSNSLDSKKSTKELVDTKNSEVGKINKLVDKAKSNINKNIQNYASDILLNNKEMDANA